MEGMDPSMLKAATDMFAKMSPEQRAQMQDQASKLDPSQIQQAMNAMKSMTPEQRAHMEQMARNSNPEELLRRASQATATAGSGSLSERLKAEGNALFKQGKFLEASDKYMDAIRESQRANENTVLKSCYLNLSSCSLQLEKFDSCVSHCNSVLDIDTMNMKAYYRRGQAFIGLKKRSSAVKDLQTALRLAGEQDAVLIREKLSLAQSMNTPGFSNQQENLGNNDDLVKEVIVEEVTMERVEESIEDVEYDDAHGATTSVNEGRPTPASAHPSTGGQTYSSMDPDAIKNAAKMMENMDPATMEQMMKMSGAPPGMTLDPSMVKMAAKMMETMSPEDIQRMQDMSRTFASQGTPVQSNGASDGAPSMQNLSPSSMDDMRKMAQNPEMLKHMQHMMKNMDPNDLCSMMKASGVNVTPEQAKKMVDQLGNLNDVQIARIAKVVKVIGSLASVYQKSKNYIKQNLSMALAILILVIALFLRWKGVL